MARMGTYLEKDIALLFKRIGFNVFLNSKEFGFESDVIAKKDEFNILIQTKQYDNSYINVADLLHQWASKGKHNNVDRTLVVITGYQVQDKWFHLAKDLGIYLWNDKILDEIKNIESNKDLYEKIGEILEFEDIMKKIEIDNKIRAEKNKKLKKKFTLIKIIVSVIIFIGFIGFGYSTGTYSADIFMGYFGGFIFALFSYFVIGAIQ